MKERKKNLRLKIKIMPSKVISLKMIILIMSMKVSLLSKMSIRLT